MRPLVPKVDAYAAFRYRNFQLLIFGRLLASLGTQATDVAVGWDLYNRTHSIFALGFVGLVLVIPVMLLSLPAGHVADTYHRKSIVLISEVLRLVSAFGLVLVAFSNGPIPLIYLCLFFIGVANAFSNPASSTLLPQAVPSEIYTNAATWSSSAWQLASVLGPALGGIIIAVKGNASFVYVFFLGTVSIYLILMWLFRSNQQLAVTRERATIQSLVEGFEFLRQSQILLGAITLDMFAVLLGGATTLLPVFAKDILHVGPVGLGWLRAAPSIGALITVFTLAYLPPFKRTGYTLLLAVTGFGIATIIFGISHSFGLSLVMLAILGGLDNISVIIRSSLFLVYTPDELRGRASAVNNLFIGASNELGGFESGIVAGFFGPLFAVIGGGIGTLLVVSSVAWLWPELRRLGAMKAPAETT